MEFREDFKKIGHEKDDSFESHKHKSTYAQAYFNYISSVVGIGTLPITSYSKESSFSLSLPPKWDGYCP
jgi:hypothetical protein